MIRVPLPVRSNKGTDILNVAFAPVNSRALTLCRCPQAQPHGCAPRGAPAARPGMSA